MKLLIRLFSTIVIFSSYLNVIQAQKLSGFIDNPTFSEAVRFTYFIGLIPHFDSTEVTTKGFFSKHLFFDKETYVTIQYKSFSKRIYIFPKANIQIRFDAKNTTSFKNSFQITGDYRINAYIDSITYHNYEYKFVTNRVNIKLPIDSFSLVLNGLRSYADSLRNTFSISKYTSVLL